MSKQLHESEAEIFRTAMGDVEPLAAEHAEPYRQRPPPLPRPQPEAADVDEGPAPLAESEVTTHDYLLFARPGIQKRVVAELQRGRIEPALEVDLHGLRVAHARALLGDFFADCRHRRVRCARIIHGKGRRSDGNQPVLKCKVNYWLRLHEEVLAFCSAPRRDGGTGAVYVLFRNPDKGSDRGPRF
ncbi:Smr/MutS family protein [uncultured Thiohalocapsa sp.]|uniref:Smr/MutS family protein n=1 Tax=uncultured Thiohalocapsa sp. TaxID=768990 RepID=UPI0025FA0F72|nr:Smr/MutS family protein [uncultured Thiohalocapsa sp.]